MRFEEKKIILRWGWILSAWDCRMYFLIRKPVNSIRQTRMKRVELER